MNLIEEFKKFIKSLDVSKEEAVIIFKDGKKMTIKINGDVLIEDITLIN